MKINKFLVTICALAVAGCGGAANTSSNANSNVSRTNSLTNSATNTISNAANTVANTVSNTAAAMTTDSPEDFMEMAAQSGNFEVETGKIAATKAQNAEVKAYGTMMTTDHTKAGAELKALAGKKTVTLPTDLGPHKSTADDLKGVTGPEFDRAYVEAMVDAHETDVAAFEKQANNSADPDVKAFAAKTLPTLKMHLEKIKAIQAKLK